MRIISASLNILALAGALCAAPSQVSAADPAALAQVTVVGKSRGGAQFTSALTVDGESISKLIYYTLLELDEKTILISIIDFDKLKGDEDDKIKAFKQMQKAANLGKRVAIKGRLVPESKEVNTGANRFTSKEILTLKELKQLILLAEAITELDDKNKDQFPAHGKVRAEGKSVCGKMDLKLLDEPTLAIENGSLPILLDGEKSKVKAGKTPVRVVGSLKIDDKGLVRLIADEVKEIGK